MSGNERSDPKTGPLVNLAQAYFSNLDTLMKTSEPALKGAGRWNLEVASFMARRAQAWLEVPARLGRCKTPQDLFSEQLRFWQTAAAHYADGSHRLTAALGACAMVPGLNGALAIGTAASARDYITFPEPKEAAEKVEPKRSDRRAA